MKNLEKFLIDFYTLKVGDKVWSIQEGDTEIKSFDSDDNSFPINTSNDAYTKKGCWGEDDKFPSLFKSNPFENISEYPKLMEVASIESFSDAQKRIVFGKNDKGFITIGAKDNINDICSGNSVHIHSYVREIQPKKTRLTMEDIAKLVNIDVKDLEIVKE